jgi:hypothetical protein
MQPTVIKEGTAVILRTTESMTSGKVATGSSVRYKVLRDVVSPDGRVLIPQDAEAYGKVTESRRSRRVNPGRISFSVEHVVAADGTRVPLRGKAGRKGKIPGEPLVGLALLVTGGLFGVLIHMGRDVTVPVGTQVTVYVDRDTVIGAPVAAQPGAPVAAAPAQSVAIEYPRDGRKLFRGATPKVILKVDPADKVTQAILVVNDRAIGTSVKDLGTLTFETQGFEPGQYRLQAEVTFLNGSVVRSNPITVTIAERAAPANS